jgi:hypothetical protein
MEDTGLTKSLIFYLPRYMTSQRCLHCIGSHESNCHLVDYEIHCSSFFIFKITNKSALPHIFWLKHFVCISCYMHSTCPTLFILLEPISLTDWTELHGLSLRANYTDRVTAACRRSDCQLVRIEGATWSVWRIPTPVFLEFLDRSRYFSIK